ncbi:MAG TPA: hypothetical protein VGL76_01785 [Gaiellaceae bacterium]
MGMSLLLAACGGAKPRPKTVSSGVLRSAARNTLAQTEKVTLVGTINLGSVTLSLDGTGAFAPVRRAEIHAQVTLPVLGKAPFDEVYVGGVAWVRSPVLQNGDHWVRASQAPTLGLGLFPFEHPTDLIGRLGASGKPAVLGTGTVGGVKTTHYLTQIGKYPAEAWVDGQNHVREVKVKINATTGNQKVKVALTMMLSDFGTPVTVTSPVKS